MAMTWAKDYQPIIYEWFREGMDGFQSMIPELFDVRSSTKAEERALGVGGVPIEAWEQYEREGEVAHVDVDRGYPKTFTHKEYPVRYSLKIKDIEDDQTGLIQEGVRLVGESAAQRREAHAADIFNLAFTSGLGPDAVYLCSASHPVGPDNTGELRDNTGTEAFSYTAMKNARLAMRAWTDSQSNPLRVKGRLVLLPIELEDQALEIFEAQNKPGTANNDGNAVKGFDYRIWDDLTDAESWFMLDPVRTKRFLRWYDRKLLFPKIVEETTTHITYEFMMRYSYGWTHWSFVYGNAV